MTTMKALHDRLFRNEKEHVLYRTFLARLKKGIKPHIAIERVQRGSLRKQWQRLKTADSVSFSQFCRRIQAGQSPRSAIRARGQQ